MSVAWWGIELPENIVLVHTLIAVALNSLDLYNFKVDHHIEEDENSISDNDNYDISCTDVPSPDIDSSQASLALATFQMLSIARDGSKDGLKSDVSSSSGSPLV